MIFRPPPNHFYYLKMLNYKKGNLNFSPQVVVMLSTKQTPTCTPTVSVSVMGSANAAAHPMAPGLVPIAETLIVKASKTNVLTEANALLRKNASAPRDGPEWIVQHQFAATVMLLEVDAMRRDSASVNQVTSEQATPRLKLAPRLARAFKQMPATAER